MHTEEIIKEVDLWIESLTKIRELFAKLLVSQNSNSLLFDGGLPQPRPAKKAAKRIAGKAKRVISEAGRLRIAAAVKARWAAKRAAAKKVAKKAAKKV